MTKIVAQHILECNTWEPFSNAIYVKFGAMHFIYYINRSIATKVDSTYLGY